MEKTYSQRIARVFEIVDYFLLLPAGVGALVGLAAIASSPVFSLLMFAILTVGLILLVGYYKHSRGTLNEKYISALWITTAVYNFILFLPWLYFASRVIDEEDGKKSFVVLVLFVLSYIFAIVSSIKAYSFEKRKNILFAKQKVI